MPRRNDIKRILAYSTLSQLGYMVMAVGVHAPGAAMFHLTTHAGFKALLFLCAGVFIHAYDTNDMFEIGRKGGRQLKVPMICTVIGAAALAAFEGDRDATLRAIDAAIANGWRDRLLFENPMTEQLRDDPEEYVRRSVANHLNDIS